LFVTELALDVGMLHPGALGLCSIGPLIFLNIFERCKWYTKKILQLPAVGQVTFLSVRAVDFSRR
jgi:hypothetical protein